MLKPKRLLCILLVALAWLCSSCSSALAKEYIVTQEQMNVWQTELNLQKSLIRKLTTDNQRLQLELTNYKGQLTVLKRTSQEQEIALKNSSIALNDANNLLEQYNKEVKRKERILKFQRNVYFVVGTYLLYELIKDKARD